MNENLILPGNPRYQPKQLVDIFGYDNLFRAVAEVELVGLETLAEIGVISEEDYKILTSEIKKALLKIPTTLVDRTEKEITKHDIRAWVREAQNILGENNLSKWVHIPFTSYDVLDTARSIQFKRAYDDALKPSIKEIITLLINLTRKFSDQIQIGRTHGQAALPITVGFWLASILSRITNNYLAMNQYSSVLTGKISGAVGAYNTQVALGIEERCFFFGKTFEEIVLEKVDLKSARISSQILPPEPLAYFLFSASMLSSNLGQFGRDARHLMRSEIAEIAESFEEGQVGSSTMAHKRNPINFESLEGMWLRTKNEFGKVLDTVISEHQRDLVGSSPARDFPIIMINLQTQLNTLLRKNKQGVSFLARITVNKEVCLKNFESSKDLILAEPFYIALQMAGYTGDAHELTNHTLTPIVKEKEINFLEAMAIYLDETSDEDASLAFQKIPDETKELFLSPESYIGKAKEKALEIADIAEKAVNSV